MLGRSAPARAVMAPGAPSQSTLQTLLRAAGLAMVAGVALWMPACATRSVVAPPRAVEPPPSYSTWDKLNWIQQQLNTTTEAGRPELLVHAAELYFLVERPDKAALSAREAIYTQNTNRSAGRSVTARASCVLGAVAMQRNDRPGARRELLNAIKDANDPSDAALANVLLAMVEERDMNPGLGAAYRAKVTKPGDPRIAEWVTALNGAAPVAKPVVVASNAKPQNSSPSAGNAVIPIIDRARWKPARSGADVEPMNTPRRITVHHEGKEFFGTTLDDTLRQVRNIQDYHQRGRKWADIGYHFIIDRLGNIIEARDLKYQGAHAGEKNKRGESPNAGNIGISLLGNYDVQKTTPAQDRALRDLISYLRKRYGIQSSELYTHNEIRQKFGTGSTGCPGKNLKPVIEIIRRTGGLAFDGAAASGGVAAR